MYQQLKKHGCLFFIAIVFASCSGRIFTSLWQPVHVNADGYTSEWTSPFKYYDSNSKIYYSVNNDAENLYVSVRTNDQQEQIKILYSGLQLWIDTTGKNIEATGLKFPFSTKERTHKSKRDSTTNSGEYTEQAVDQNQHTQKQNQGMGQRQHPDLNTLRMRFIHNEKSMHLTGFKAPIGGVFPVPNDFGIEAYINWDSTNTNTMIYEAVIPFATFYKKALGISDSSKVFGITISVNGLPGSTTPGGMRPGGMRVGVGMGMGMGGFGVGVGPSMGRYGYGQPVSDPLTEGKSVKAKFRLSINPELLKSENSYYYRNK